MNFDAKFFSKILANQIQQYTAIGKVLEELEGVEYISLHDNASGIHLQLQKFSQNTSWKWAGVADHWKGMYRSMQNLAGQRKKESDQDWTCIQGRGELKHQLDPHSRAIFWDSGGWRRMQELIYDSLNGMRTTQTTFVAAPPFPGQGHKSPRMCGSWELEHIDWRAISG